MSSGSFSTSLRQGMTDGRDELLDERVRDRGHHVGGGHDSDRALGVVRRDHDLVELGDRADLLHLGDAADVDDVGLGDVDGAGLEERR